MDGRRNPEIDELAEKIVEKLILVPFVSEGRVSVRIEDDGRKAKASIENAEIAMIDLPVDAIDAIRSIVDENAAPPNHAIRILVAKSHVEASTFRLDPETGGWRDKMNKIVAVRTGENQEGRFPNGLGDALLVIADEICETTKKFRIRILPPPKAEISAHERMLSASATKTIAIQLRIAIDGENPETRYSGTPLSLELVARGRHVALIETTKGHGDIRLIAAAAIKT